MLHVQAWAVRYASFFSSQDAVFIGMGDASEQMVSIWLVHSGDSVLIHSVRSGGLWYTCG